MPGPHLSCLVACSLLVGVAGTALADEPARPVGFVAHVEPTLSRLGCNAGSCHGKAGGQHGFALSLFNAQPDADWQAIKGRVDRLDPESSLLLTKPTAQVPHGGGHRLDVDSVEYLDLLRWISELKPDAARPPESKLIRLECDPSAAILSQASHGQIRVRAIRDDGTTSDVTRLCRFESSRDALAKVSPRGELVTSGGVGAVSILVRYGADLAVARVVVPSGQHPPASDPAPTSVVDRLVANSLNELGLAPGQLATDAEFARRASLDIIGRLPDPAEVIAFERDTRSDKRERWVDALLERPEYADFFALKWSAILRNRRSLGELSKPTTFAFHAWVRQAIAANLPYDRFAAAVVAAKGDVQSNPAVAWYRHVANLEDRADDVAQVFLGTRIGCARCHHHPTERWSQDDYAEFAAFFGRVGTKAGADPGSFRVFNMVGSGSQAPRPLGAASALPLGPRDDPRAALVAWMVQPENPSFSRAIVNRYWKHFFGRGLVEPEDDLRLTNPATDPDLLDALALDFRTHGFDLKRLIRTLATSDTYARSSEPPDPGTLADDQSFARFTPRRLPAEGLLDAINSIIGSPFHFDAVPAQTRAVQLPDDGFASPWLDAFGRPGRRTACECERADSPSLAQALFLLNSTDLETRLADPNGRAARYASPHDARTDLAKLDELYRVALARPPSDAEFARAIAYLKDHQATGWEDLIWALLNTKEFLYNH